jgi:succinate dehydrogenase/fumarate reductase flavoprotein subunit
MKIIYTDVLVIGGGLAGLRIGIGAKRRGHDVIILSLVLALLCGARRHASESRQRY